MEYRTRLLETVEDFFCQPNFNDSYFQAYIEGCFVGVFSLLSMCISKQYFMACR